MRCSPKMFKNESVQNPPQREKPDLLSRLERGEISRNEYLEMKMSIRKLFYDFFYSFIAFVCCHSFFNFLNQSIIPGRAKMRHTKLKVVKIQGKKIAYLKYFNNPHLNRNVGSLFKSNSLFYTTHITRAIGASEFPFYILTKARGKFHDIMEKEANIGIVQEHWKITKITQKRVQILQFSSTFSALKKKRYGCNSRF